MTRGKRSRPGNQCDICRVEYAIRTRDGVEMGMGIDGLLKSVVEMGFLLSSY